MATVRPFRALRPPRERAAEVASVPYDVVSTAEARELARGNPWSFLRVSRPEIDLPVGTDPHVEDVYRKAVENYERLKRDCPLAPEASPSLYIYRLRMGGHVQTGVAACCSIDEYDRDVIRKHERTRKDKEDDRTRHMLALGAQTGPVFLTYRGRKEIDEIIERAKRDDPLYDFAAPDGVSHTLWRLGAEAAGPLAEQFRAVPLLYIADGHHRAASASRARGERRASDPKHTGEEAYNFLLGVLFPAEQLRILPYNRVVRDLQGRSAEEFLSLLRQRLPVNEEEPAAPSRRGEVGVYLGGRWYGLRLERDGRGPAGPTSGLDVSLLQESVLEPLLGIRDVRTDKRIDFVGGIRGTRELERLVDSGEAAVAFSLYPVSLDELMSIADTNEIMPPKSTWFEPKLRDGLLVHEI
jgi:uncharacterized protein (DUF1015 family)